MKQPEKLRVDDLAMKPGNDDQIADRQLVNRLLSLLIAQWVVAGVKEDSEEIRKIYEEAEAA